MELDRSILQRWHDFGGYWHVVSQSAHSTTVALCRCDGGEEVERLTTQEWSLVDWLSKHPSSDAT